VSKFAVLYALAKQARNLGAFKLARHVLDRINNLKVSCYHRSGYIRMDQHCFWKLDPDPHYNENLDPDPL
jgi:hypothetical protein